MTQKHLQSFSQRLNFCVKVLRIAQKCFLQENDANNSAHAAKIATQQGKYLNNLNFLSNTILLSQKKTPDRVNFNINEAKKKVRHSTKNLCTQIHLRYYVDLII